MLFNPADHWVSYQTRALVVDCPAAIFRLVKININQERERERVPLETG